MSLETKMREVDELRKEIKRLRGLLKLIVSRMSWDPELTGGEFKNLRLVLTDNEVKKIKSESQKDSNSNNESEKPNGQTR